MKSKPHLCSSFGVPTCPACASQTNLEAPLCHSSMVAARAAGNSRTAPGRLRLLQGCRALHELEESAVPRRDQSRRRLDDERVEAPAPVVAAVQAIDRNGIP